MVYYEYGICGHLHPWKWRGDCREDDNRFASSDLEDAGVDIYDSHVVRTWEERVEADKRGQ